MASGLLKENSVPGFQTVTRLESKCWFQGYGIQNFILILVKIVT